MPNWKKVITSGSNAHLNHITASGAIKSTGNILSSGRVTGNELAGTIITAAQTNITSLGTLSTLTVDDITINGSRISDAGDLTIDAGGDILIDADGGDIFFMDNGTTRLAFDTTQGNITASGDISASGNLNSNKLLLNNTNGNDNLEGTSDGVTYKSNNHRFIGHITASANISGSSTSNITIGGDFKGMTEDSQLLIGHQQAANFAKVQVSEHNDGVTPVAMDFLKSRGTLKSPTTVARGDFTGTQRYYGHDGSSYRLSAAIRGDIDSGATVGTNVMPGALNFLTTTNGSLNSRMFIASTGNIGIGVGNTNTGPAAKLDVDGNIQTTSHITASGNISSSGTITMLTASIGGGIFTSASLAAGGGGGGSFNNFTLTADGGSNQTINDGQTLDIAGGTNITTAVGATDTVTINLDTSPSITNLTASGDISASGNIDTNIYKSNGATFAQYTGGVVNLGGGTANPAAISGTTIKLGTNTNQHITASGNISSSGALQVGGNITTDLGLRLDGDKVIKYSSGEFVLGGSGTENIKLGDISAQNIITRGAGHITASGNISASGATFHGVLKLTGGSAELDLGTSVAIRYDNNANLNALSADGNTVKFAGGGSWTDVQIGRAASQPKNIQIYGPITASHPISASGTSIVQNLNVFSPAGTIKMGENVAGNFDGMAVQGVITSSGNLILQGDINARNITDVTNITASGNISASGYGDGGILEINRNSATAEAIIGVDTANAVGNSAFHLNVDGINKITMKKNHLETIVRSDIAVGDGVSTIIMESASGDLQLTGSGKLYGSSSYLTIANDGTAPSELRLNCEANTHYIGIRGPVHSGASSYVLKLPNSAPSDNQILKVNGSPSNGEVTLAWEADADSGGGGGVSFPTTTVISSSTDLFIGKTDGAFLSASTGNVEISGSGRGQLEVDYRLFDTGSSHLSSAGGGVGDIVKFGGSSTQAGDIYYLKTDGTWDEARANAVSTSTGSLAVALGSNSTTDGMLLKGMVKLDSDPSATIGNPVFLDDTAAGHARNDAPDSGGDIVRIVGYYYGSGGLIYFNPDNTFIEVAS